MTQKEKELLLQDLCGRIPYNIKFNFCNNTYVMTGIRLFVTDDCGWDYGVTSKDISEPVEIGFIKPYLRPMSSMTEKEYQELDVLAYGCDCVLYFSITYDAEFKTYSLKVIDWLNAHHFDYRGLIGLGLALEAPEGTYKIK
jgi:hypothetical protein